MHLWNNRTGQSGSGKSEGIILSRRVTIGFSGRLFLEKVKE